MGEPVLGGESTRLDDVFRRERDTAERTVPRRSLGSHLDPGVNRRVELADTLNTGLHFAFAVIARGGEPVSEAEARDGPYGVQDV